MTSELEQGLGGAWEEPGPRRRRGPWLLISLVVLALASMTCLTCGVGVTWLGLDLVRQEVQETLSHNSILEREIGALQKLELDWSRSFEAEADVFVFDVIGASSRGRLRVETVTGEDDLEVILWAELEHPDGRRVEIVPREPEQE